MKNRTICLYFIFITLILFISCIKPLENNIFIPQTDEDVIEQFANQYQDELVRNSLIGLFRCRRKKGDDILTAYEYVLSVHIQGSNQFYFKNSFYENDVIVGISK